MSTIRHYIMRDDGSTEIVAEERDDGASHVLHHAHASFAHYDEYVSKRDRLARIRTRIETSTPFHPFYDDVKWLLGLVEAKS